MLFIWPNENPKHFEANDCYRKCVGNSPRSDAVLLKVCAHNKMKGFF